MFKATMRELRQHMPFTAVGAVSGILLMVVFLQIPPRVSYRIFYTLHPAHVLLSALATAGMYRLHSKGKLLPTLLIGYFGAVGMATLSDSLIPYLGEFLLDLPNREAHIGFIEEWWLVNPLAIAGALIACLRPSTKFPHAGHVLLSTWASLFHIIMALGGSVSMLSIIVVPVFLFFAVWIPCCMSDIVFPLLFAGEPPGDHRHHHHGT
ncbi:MAG: hypothetical protein QGD94_01590 [Planctomycetia bacterium]|nr:hypothetical protein [Planctomycetia bacterium]